MPATNPLLDDLGLDLDEMDLGDGSIDEMVAELEDFLYDEKNSHTEVKVSKFPDCDLCKLLRQPKTTPAIYDGKTTHGPWGYMCQRHFDSNGIGLGLGRGQKLILDKSSHLVPE